MGDLHQMLNKMGQTYYTDNRMLNIILNDKLKKAVQEGIAVDVKIGNISLDGMKDVEITTIFANLLDNAIEAAVQAEGEKFIKIQAERFHDFHIIKLINEKGKNGKKEGHIGIGLENVRNALKKYEGTMEIKEEKDYEKEGVTGTKEPDTGEEFATAVIVAEYENGKNQYTITFNKSMQLTGFFVK